MKQILHDLFDHMAKSALLVDTIYLIPKDGKLYVHGRIEVLPKKANNADQSHTNKYLKGFINAYSFSDFDAFDQPCWISTKDLISMSKRGFFKKSDIKGANFEFSILGIEDNRYILRVSREDGMVSKNYLLPCEPPPQSAEGKVKSHIKYGIEWMPLTSAVRRLKAQAKVAKYVTFAIENEKLVGRFKEDNLSGYCVLHHHPIKKLSNALPPKTYHFNALMISAALSSLGIKKVLIEERDLFAEVQCRSDYFTYNYYFFTQ